MARDDALALALHFEGGDVADETARLLLAELDAANVLRLPFDVGEVASSMPRNFVFGIRGRDRVERPEREQDAVCDDEPVPGLCRRLQVRRAVRRSVAVG